MATVSDATDGEIRRLNRDTTKLQAETRKLLAEADKLKAEKYKLSAESSKLGRNTFPPPWMLLAQGPIAGAALIGAGAALVKLLIG